MLSRIGSYFVGTKLAMFVLGFFSKHTSERGLLTGVAVGFAAIWAVATQTELAWPWYAVVGSSVNIAVSLLVSRLLDGRKADWSPWSVPGTIARVQEDGTPTRQAGWHILPGRIDPASKWLPLYFLATVAVLCGLEASL